MNTSRAPLAQSEDFDNLSLQSNGSLRSIPTADQNHNLPPRKRPPQIFTFDNNNIPPAPTPLQVVKKPFPIKEPPPPPQELEPSFDTDDASFCNPAFLIALVYFCGAMFFLVGLNVKGLTMLRYPWIGNLLSLDYQDLDFFHGVVILQVMWCVHFVRRCAQTLFLNRYHGKLICVVFMCMLLYYIIFGFWVGWSLNFYLDYAIPKPIFIAPGVIIYLLGEFGNFYCHWLLKDIRVQPSGILVPSTSGYKPNLPDSILFKYATYPQFAFEVLSWIGFYLSAHTIAAGAFLLATLMYVIALSVTSYVQMKRNYVLVRNKQPWER